MDSIKKTLTGFGLFIFFILFSNSTLAYSYYVTPTPILKSSDPYHIWIDKITPHATMEVIPSTPPWGLALLTNDPMDFQDTWSDVEFYLQTVEIPGTPISSSPPPIAKKIKTTTPPFTFFKKDLNHLLAYLTKDETIISFFSGAFVLLLGIIVGMILTKMSLRKQQRRW